VIEWLELAGVFDLTPEQLPPGLGKFNGIPHVSGTKGGHTLNLHQFAREDVSLLGHLRVASDHHIFLAPDLHENLRRADRFEAEVLEMIDGYIQANGLDAPPEDVPQLRDGYEQPVIMQLDLKAHGIKTILWAMGYTFDYSLVKLPVCDADGFPIQTNGVSPYGGLYFVGMPWMPTERPGSLLGVAERAEYIVSRIMELEAG
jgi:putative flavoprotein involved in K+ transport